VIHTQSDFITGQNICGITGIQLDQNILICRTNLTH